MRRLYRMDSPISDGGQSYFLVLPVRTSAVKIGLNRWDTVAPVRHVANVLLGKESMTTIQSCSSPRSGAASLTGTRPHLAGDDCAARARLVAQPVHGIRDISLATRRNGVAASAGSGCERGGAVKSFKEGTIQH